MVRMYKMGAYNNWDERLWSEFGIGWAFPKKRTGAVGEETRQAGKMRTFQRAAWEKTMRCKTRRIEA